MWVSCVRILDNARTGRTGHICVRNIPTQLGPSVVIHLPLLAGLSTTTEWKAMITCKVCENKFISFSENGLCNECGEPWSHDQNKQLMTPEPKGWKVSDRQTLAANKLENGNHVRRKETDWLKVAVSTVLVLFGLALSLARTARNFGRSFNSHSVNTPAENTEQHITGVN